MTSRCRHAKGRARVRAASPRCRDVARSRPRRQHQTQHTTGDPGGRGAGGEGLPSPPMPRHATSPAPRLSVDPAGWDAATSVGENGIAGRSAAPVRRFVHLVRRGLPVGRELGSANAHTAPDRALRVRLLELPEPESRTQRRHACRVPPAELVPRSDQSATSKCPRWGRGHLPPAFQAFSSWRCRAQPVSPL